jgi:arylsulfatase A-like enzyme
MRCDKPNILFIMTDQQSANAMSCTGNTDLRTPAMDRLAATGVRFEKAYCTFPLCVPSRVSLFSGLMPHEAGVFVNCPESETGFPRIQLGALLRDGGYACHYVGKWHLTVPERDKSAHGFDEVVFGGGYGDLDSKKAQAAADFLKKGHEKPFFLVVSFNNPHDCCELARGEPLKMEALPPEPGPESFPPLPANAAIPECEPDGLRDFQNANSDRVFPSARWGESEIRRYRWGYNRLVERVDHHIGTVLDALRERGLEEETVIVFTSDHGDGQGCHRWNQKWSLYDESVRVPFMVSWKGKTHPGARVSNLVATGLDLMPTLCDYAGLCPPEGLAGMSLRGLSEGLVPGEWRPYLVAETTFGNWGKVGEDAWPKARMVRTERYKYIALDGGERREQLLDMDRDPDETVNLAGEVACRDVLRDHRAHLRDWCERTQDHFMCI